MSHRIRILVMLAVTTVVATNAAVAWAYFTKAGTGTAPATVGTLSAPSSVGVPASPATSTIHVTWNGVTAPTGPTVGYWVQRYSGTTPTNACGSSKSSPIASGTGAKNCDDTGVNPGTYTYTVTSVWRSWTAQSSPSSSVTVAGLDHFVVAAPASTTAGSSFSVTITAQDASNNTFSGYRGAIHFASSDGQAGLPSNYTFIATDNGVRTFTNLTTLKTAGSQTITTNDTAQTTKTGTATVTVSPASLDHFTVTNPGTQTAGTAFTATIRALDLYNNAANGWTATTQCVTFSGPTSSPDGTAPTYPAAGSCGTGSSNLTFDSSGQATATVTLRSAGSTTLTVTGSTKSGTSTSFTVNAAGAARLAWTNVTKSAGTLSNPCLFTCTDTALANFGTFSANVSVTDNFGNIVSGLGTGHTVTVSTPTSGAGSGGAFTAPTAGTSVTLTISSSGAASSTVQFTFKAQNGSWSSDTFTAQTASGTSYTSATATVTKS